MSATPFSEKTCLKCGYTRKNSDSAPDYECPHCGVVYAKFEARHSSRAHSPETPTPTLANKKVGDLDRVQYLISSKNRKRIYIQYDSDILRLNQLDQKSAGVAVLCGAIVFGAMRWLLGPESHYIVGATIALLCTSFVMDFVQHKERKLINALKDHLESNWYSYLVDELQENFGFIVSDFHGIDTDSGANCIMADTLSKSIALVSVKGFRMVGGTIINASDILDVEVIQNGQTLLNTSSTAQQVASAAVGGALFGGAGAIVGAIVGSSLKKDLPDQMIVSLRLLINSTQTPYVEYTFYEGKTTADSPDLKKQLKAAEHWFGLIKVMIHRTRVG
jgi:predicted RNA-binding Zn-ribbon protein involved in translation (DUF1610 family)